MKVTLLCLQRVRQVSLHALDLGNRDASDMVGARFPLLGTSVARSRRDSRGVRQENAEVEKE